MSLRMQPTDVHRFMELIQSCAHLSFPVLIDPKQGHVLLHTTPDTLYDLTLVITSFPFPVEIVYE